MIYNFDEIIDRRNTNSVNTEGFNDYIFHAKPRTAFSLQEKEFLRMWIADMEFAAPPEICEAMKERVDKRIFGYSKVFDTEYFMAFHRWCEKHYDWCFKKEELVFSPGIVPALYELVEELVKYEDRMLIVTPAYGHFKHAAEYSRIELVCSDLKRNEDGFIIDFVDFERKASDSKMKLLLWCNPHNPTGRMWTEQELKQVAEIAEKNDLWIISDEIHCDLIRKNRKHIPMGKVMPEYKKLITCMSASKTFNIAGLMFSNIIIRDEELRMQFSKRDKTMGLINPLSIEAHKAAYERGEEWLEQLKEYLDSNFKFVENYLEKYLPKAVFKIPEATYLAWIDLNPYLSKVEDLPSFFANEAGVILEGGDDLFVGNAKGYIRLNLAMPKAMIQKGMYRIREAIYRKLNKVS